MGCAHDANCQATRFSSAPKRQERKFLQPKRQMKNPNKRPIRSNTNSHHKVMETLHAVRRQRNLKTPPLVWSYNQATRTVSFRHPSSLHHQSATGGDQPSTWKKLSVLTTLDYLRRSQDMTKDGKRPFNLNNEMSSPTTRKRFDST